MEFLNNSSSLRVLIVGDVMLDRYWWGNVTRISPEAPVPIVDLDRISATAGGAANVAANVAGLGAEPILVGMIGDDEEADVVSEVLSAKNVSPEFLVKSNERRTSVKTRVIAHNQQMVRIDRETKNELNAIEEDLLGNIIDSLVDKVQIIIVSDYGKGVATKKILSRLITKGLVQNKFIFIDPKGKDYTKYRGATILTPNRLELTEARNIGESSQNALEAAGNQLIAELGLEYLLVTQGEDGMTLLDKEENAVYLPVESKNVYDVTGAGDTVIACLATAVGCGADFIEAARFANKAAGLVVGQLGTTAISLKMLNQ